MPAGNRSLAPLGGETFVSKFDKEDHALDLTRENVVNETDLMERIRRLFDEGRNPDVIKVTSRQAMDVLDNSPRMQGYDRYCSPFGDHEVRIIPAKDIA